MLIVQGLGANNSMPSHTCTPTPGMGPDGQRNKTTRGLVSGLLGALLIATHAFAQGSSTESLGSSDAAVSSAASTSAPAPAPTPLVFTPITYPYVAQREPPPDVLPYDPSRPIAPGYELQNHIRVGYVISGSIVGGIGYGLSAVVALSGNPTDFQRGWLMVPVLGPFISMATQTETCERGYPVPEQCGKNSGTVLGLAILGTMQVVGGALFAYGELSRKPRLVLKQEYSLHLTPAAIGQGGYGLTAFGEF
jgi:hypothetical protein